MMIKFIRFIYLLFNSKMHLLFNFHKSNVNSSKTLVFEFKKSLLLPS